MDPRYSLSDIAELLTDNEGVAVSKTSSRVCHEKVL
jgi:hypothetical protein